MKKFLLILAIAGYMSACAPTSNTTSSTGTTNDQVSSDSNTSEDRTTETSPAGTINSNADANSGSSSSATKADTNSSNSTTNTDMDNSSATDTTSANSDMETADKESAETAVTTPTESSSPMGTAVGTMTESDLMGTSTTITMDQLPKAVRDAYMKMPGHANATGVKVSQVKTSEHPVVYKIEGTSGSTDYVHYFTPEGTEVRMPKK